MWRGSGASSSHSWQIGLFLPLHWDKNLLKKQYLPLNASFVCPPISTISWKEGLGFHYLLPFQKGQLTGTDLHIPAARKMDQEQCLPSSIFIPYDAHPGKKKEWSRLPCRVKVSAFTESSATEVDEVWLLLCWRTWLGSQCQVSSQQQQQRVSANAHIQQQQQQQFQSGFLSGGLSFLLASCSYQISSQLDLDRAQFSLKLSGMLLLKYCIYNPADLVTMRRVGLSWSKWKRSHTHSYSKK